MRWLLFLLCAVSLWAEDPAWEVHKEDTFFFHPYIPGFCNRDKAEKIMDLIYETKPKLCVEIGALGGSTTYPIARALHFLKEGKLYAIDAWDHEAFCEGLEADDSNLHYWASLHYDLDKVYRQLLFLLQTGQLGPYCIPLRMRSEQAVMFFEKETIDLLYLDGNLSSRGSLQDAKLYLPKVKPGGYIWLNLADQSTKAKTVAFLMKNCAWLRDQSIGMECLLFQKR